MMKKILFLPFLLILMVSCQGVGGRTLTSATGSIYECLVVVPNHTLTTEQKAAVQAAHLQKEDGSSYVEDIVTLYDLIRAVMGADMPCMPQMEPYFKMAQVTPQLFDNLLKPTRNILVVDIDPEHLTQLSIKAQRDVWSTPQAVYRLAAPTADEIVQYWLTKGEQVRDWFVNQEIQRQLHFYRAATDKDIRARLKQNFNCDMLVTNDYMLLMDTVLVLPHLLTAAQEEALADPSVRVLWTCNNKGSLRRDLVVYSYPYTDSETFTLPYLNKRRDEVLSQLVTAGVAGTYMGTEYRYFPPEMRVLTVDSTYTCEVRGLWKMLGGEAMGGPYVSHTWLDQVNARIVTAEVFVFAPGQKKRNPLRQAEAILYSRKCE